MDDPVASRAHRTLKQLAQYKSLAGRPLFELPDELQQLSLKLGDEQIIGVYENCPSQIDDSIVITNLGLHVFRGGIWSCIRYKDVRGIPPIEDKQSEDMVLYVRDGIQTLHVRGKSGRFMDIFEFQRFLLRVTKADIDKIEHK